MFIKRNDEPLSIGGMYEGGSVFLFGGGRSISPRHIQLSKRPGIVSAAVNEGGHYIKPNIYMSTSGITMPHSVLNDPTVMKFVNSRHWDKPLYEDRTRGKLIKDYPNVVGMKVKTRPFDKFLNDDFVYQQEQQTGKFAKNSAITFINVLIHLGFRKIYLVGMDFYSDTNSCTYFYERDYINTIKPEIIGKVKDSLKQLLDLEKVHIYNTNPRGGLDFFKFIPFENAISRSETHYKSDINADFNKERAVWGWKMYLNRDKSHLLKK